MSARTAALAGLAVVVFGCGGGGGFYSYDYSPAAVGLAPGSAAGGAKTEAAPAAKPAGPATGETKMTAPTRPAGGPQDPEEFVKTLPANPRGETPDGLVRSRDWKALDWANPAEVSPWRKKKSGEDVVLVVRLKGGEEDKTAVSRPVGLAAKANGQLRMDVYNATSHEVPIAFAVFASVDRVYSESATQVLKPGWNRVVYELAAATYKSAASEWKNNTRIWGADDVREIIVLFYDDKPATFAIDGIEIDGNVTQPN